MVANQFLVAFKAAVALGLDFVLPFPEGSVVAEKVFVLLAFF